MRMCDRGLSDTVRARRGIAIWRKAHASVYAYESNEVYFARLRIRLCVYANVCVKKEVYLGLNAHQGCTYLIKNSQNGKIVKDYYSLK